jgi:hypothetical protein
MPMLVALIQFDSYWCTHYNYNTVIISVVTMCDYRPSYARIVGTRPFLGINIHRVCLRAADTSPPRLSHQPSNNLISHFQIR